MLRKYESISQPNLTDPEALLIGRLISLHYHAGDQFSLADVRERLFPVASEDHIDTIEDWACRGLLTDLADKGYLARTYIPGLPAHENKVLTVTRQAIDAYRAWYDRRGHMSDDSNALLP